MRTMALGFLPDLYLYSTSSPRARSSFSLLCKQVIVISARTLSRFHECRVFRCCRSPTRRAGQESAVPYVSAETWAQKPATTFSLCYLQSVACEYLERRSSQRVSFPSQRYQQRIATTFLYPLAGEQSNQIEFREASVRRSHD